MLACDAQLRDVIGAAEDVLQTLRAAPPHVRPWLRGMEAEAERVAIEVSALRNRAANKFLSWGLLGVDGGDGDARP